jgi:dethiobiotin synthetase
MMIDLPKRWGLPVILVARPNLGTINHTLLSLAALRRLRIRVAGVVFNAATPPPRERWARYAIKHNPEALARLAGVPLLGNLPYRENADALPDDNWVCRHLDMPFLLKTLG